jgi:hypothetical protein
MDTLPDEWSNPARFNKREPGLREIIDKERRGIWEIQSQHWNRSADSVAG